MNGFTFLARATSTTRNDPQRTPTDAFFLRFGPGPFEEDRRYLGDREAQKIALHEVFQNVQVFSITQVV